MQTNERSLVLQNAIAITPFRRERNCSFVIESGRIAQMGRLDDIDIPPHAEWIDLSGCYVMPGFIDLHVHGGGGFDFADDRSEAIETVSRTHAEHGTTSILATLYPQAEDAFYDSIRRVREYCERSGFLKTVEGIHLEGPFLNPEVPGVLRPELMWDSDVEKFHRILECGGSWIRVMTIAPCIPRGMQLLREAALRGANGNEADRLQISVGHSRATYEQIDEAIDCGLAGVTHIYNGMPPMHHRSPGVLAASLLRDELHAEVIADGIHVHPANLQLLVKIKGCDRIVLVTDAIRAACMPEGTYEFLGQEVRVCHSQACLANAPQTLAGSTLTMDRAIRTMVQKAHVTLEQAAQMASLNAARVLSWEHRRGILGIGRDADLAVLSRDLETVMTIKAGHIIYRDMALGQEREGDSDSVKSMKEVA